MEGPHSFCSMHSGIDEYNVEQNRLCAGPSHVQKPAAEPNGAANGKQVSTSDIQRVQNYIEKCLQLYLTQKEVRPSLSATCCTTMAGPSHGRRCGSLQGLP